MAYIATITPEEKRISGRRYLFVTIVEADAAAASEWEIENFPFYSATLIKYQATLVTATSTGTTINPKLGKATGWSSDTQDDIGTNGTTAAYIDDETHIFFTCPLGSIFGVSQVDAGTDNDVQTLLVFVEGEAP